MKKQRNYARFYCLLRAAMPEMDRDEAKELVASQVSGGRTESLRDLTDREWLKALQMVERLQADRGQDLRVARSKALVQLQQYGIKTIDWDEVNRFVSQPRIAGKPFYELSESELAALTRKMRAINRKKKSTPRPPQTPKQSKKPIEYKVIYVTAPRREILN